MTNKGFTLIELMIVITIIAILSAMGFFGFSRVQKQARDAVRKGDLRAVAQAAQAYSNDNSGNYPAAGSWSTLLAPTYLPRIPTDPGTTSYSYRSASATQFSVCATLEAGATGFPIWQVSQLYPGGHALAACGDE